MPVLRSTIALLILFATMALSGCVGTSGSVRVGIPGLPAEPAEAPPASVAKGPPPWAPAHGRRAKYQYRYYPQVSVYRDDTRGLWFYFADGKWTARANLPVDIRIDVGDYVTVSMNTDTPYVHHDAVVKRHPPGQVTAKHNKGKKKEKYKN